MEMKIYNRIDKRDIGKYLKVMTEQEMKDKTPQTAEYTD